MSLPGFSHAFGKFSQKLQGPKNEIERLGLQCSSNKSKMPSSLSVESTLYTRGYLAAPDHCRQCVLCAMDACQT